VKRSSAYVDVAFFGMPRDTEATSLGGGRNSQVFLLESAGREPMVFKRYFVDPRDRRDRQGTEARALRFMEQAGIVDSPLLLAMDTDRQASMLSYIKGEKVTEATLEDVTMAADFLLGLIRLSGTEEAVAAGFGPASEAFFSVAGVLGNIEARLARLEGACQECPLGNQLHDMLNNRLQPLLASCRERCGEQLEQASMTLEEEIPEAWRILSPSDFGTHNAVRRPDGGLTFFDYEYFGWDDPSKTLADFCLHPAMTLSGPMQARFLAALLPELEKRGYRRARARAMFPLFAIKWCCILLNEFVPRDADRRKFAGNERTQAQDRVLGRQLDKALALLGSLESRTATFASLLDQVQG